MGMSFSFYMNVGISLPNSSTAEISQRPFTCTTSGTSCTASTNASSVRFVFCITVTAHGRNHSVSSNPRCKPGRIEGEAGARLILVSSSLVTYSLLSPPLVLLQWCCLQWRWKKWIQSMGNLSVWVLPGSVPFLFSLCQTLKSKTECWTPKSSSHQRARSVATPKCAQKKIRAWRNTMIYKGTVPDRTWILKHHTAVVLICPLRLFSCFEMSKRSFVKMVSGFLTASCLDIMFHPAPHKNKKWNV